MTETPQQFHDRVRAAADDAGRLPPPQMDGWDVFPFEPEGLQVVPLAPPKLPEPPRQGEGGVDCRACVRADPAHRVEDEVWRNERWRLVVLRDSGVPLLLMLWPLAHHDLPDLPDELAGELGRLQVHLARAIEALPHVARCHVGRWGDGGAHLHVFFFARPAGFGQLQGNWMSVWDEILPTVPRELTDAGVRTVTAALVRSYGGAARSPATPASR